MKTMFQVMSSVTKGYEPTPEELKSIVPFIWCRFLCGNPVLIPYALLFNNNEIPMELQYKVISKVCAQHNIKYIPYPKSVHEQDSSDVDILSKYFKINSVKAKEYLDLISKDELDQIRKIYGGKL